MERMNGQHPRKSAWSCLIPMELKLEPTLNIVLVGFFGYKIQRDLVFELRIEMSD